MSAPESWQINPTKKPDLHYGDWQSGFKDASERIYPHQTWYHYEFWEEGDRLSKKSRYIPKRLLSRVEKLEAEKAPVREILKLLGVRE